MKDKIKVKYLRTVAWISIFVIVAFMLIELFQFQEDRETSVLQNQLEYYFNEDWTVVFLKDINLSDEELENHNRIEELAKDSVSKEVTLPYSEKDKTGGIFVFKNTLPEDFAGHSMKFLSTNATVRVVLDSEVIYQYGFDDDKSQTVLRETEHYMDIPNEFGAGELWIELIPLNSSMEVSLGDIQVETGGDVVVGVVGNRITDIGCCLLIVIMSIAMFVLMLIRWYTLQPNRGEVFLGLAGIVAGIYCFIETGTLEIFYDIESAYEMQEYLVLLLLLCLTLYFEWNLNTIFAHRFYVLLLAVIINADMQIALQAFGICSLEDMTKISFITAAVICLTAVISLFQFYYRKRFFTTLLSALSILVLLLGGMASIINTVFLEYGRRNVAGQYSITLFSIITAIIHTMQFAKEYRTTADAARREALAANEAKGKFLAHMSHEIRTPINAVLGMDEMILRESKEQNIKDYAMDIYTAGQTLLSLINDILDLSKIDSGKMEIVLAEYDISSLIHDLANMASQRAKDKNIKLEVKVDSEIPSRLYGDDVRIRQILTNILTNAIKYTPEGTVWLRVKKCGNSEMALLRFEVEDTGIGIKEDDLPKLFAEFERIEENRNRNIEGTGLGMSITLQLLALMGSRLQVESVYGKGSKFYFDLEQKIVDNTPVGDFESRVHKLAQNYNYSAKFYAPDAKILVVDDNAVNRKVLRNLLKKTQIQVTDASGGIECLELVKQNHYDLIFLDHMMPDMDGVETLHHIKEMSDSPCKDTPIIVLTANAVSGAKEKYLSEGFDGFLSKPVIPEKLESTIKKVLPEKLLRETTDVSEEVSVNSLEELPQVDGLDWSYALLHLPDMELLAYTVKEFYAQIDFAADKLEQAYTNITEPEQLEQYRIQVHAMKSLAATIGIMPLSGLAKILEYAAKDGNIDVLMSLTTVFLEEWRSYHKKLEGVFGIEAITKKEVTDYSVILALVEMLKISMQDMDIDQADKLINQLKEYTYPDEIEQNMKKLAEAVNNLDADETDYLADLLTKQMQA